MKATRVDSIRSYLTEIGRTPLLSSEQEITLGRKVQKLRFLLAKEKEAIAKLQGTWKDKTASYF